MKTKLRFTSFIVALLIFASLKGNAQVHVGIYHEGILSHIGVGTDPEKKIFAEA